MENNLYVGELVRLTAEEPAVIAESFSRWQRNSEYLRMLDTSPASMWSLKKIKEWLEKDQEKETKEDFFAIRTLAEDRLIGFVGLSSGPRGSVDSYVGIGIGEPELWGKGYGTDAMRLALRYAFMERNLHRVSLSVFEYNPRGVRSYEKAGFREEGRQRQYLLRDGRRWDMIHMGVLREEWLAANYLHA